MVYCEWYCYVLLTIDHEHPSAQVPLKRDEEELLFVPHSVAANMCDATAAGFSTIAGYPLFNRLQK